MVRIILLFAVLSLPTRSFGQATFEVADVRMYKPDAGMPRTQGIIVAGRNGALTLTNFSQIPGQRMQLGEPVFAPNGTVSMRSATMGELIREANQELARLIVNNIWTKYIAGGPDWLYTEHYEVIAKAPTGTPLDTERLMLQTMLGERFHLAMHREQKPMPVYALVLGKKELKLQAPAGSGDPDCKNKFSQADGHTHATCTNVTTAELVDHLARLEPFDLDQPVIDSTGMTGTYDLTFEWTPHGPGPDPVGVTIFDAMEKLGLKLEARKQPMPVIVIDHVDRIPTDN
jgi:uncharacterized protein (TIGR03435 family)